MLHSCICSHCHRRYVHTCQCLKGWCKCSAVASCIYNDHHRASGETARRQGMSRVHWSCNTVLLKPYRQHCRSMSSSRSCLGLTGRSPLQVNPHSCAPAKQSTCLDFARCRLIAACLMYNLTRLTCQERMIARRMRNSTGACYDSNAVSTMCTFP